MSDKHLGELSWKLLAKKYGIKDTNLTNAFGDYAKALGDFAKAKEEDQEAQLKAIDNRLEALSKVERSATKLKSDDATAAELKAYLKLVLDEADDSRKAAAALKKSASKGDDEETSVDEAVIKKKLVGALATVKSLKPDQPQMQFMVGLVKAESALIIAKAVGNTQKGMLQKMLGGLPGAAFHTGDCIWEEKAYTFVFKTVPASIDRKLQQAILKETGKKFKVRVRNRDGTEVSETVDIDLDADDEPGPAQPGPQEPTKQAQKSEENVKVRIKVAQEDARLRVKSVQESIPRLVKTAAYAKTQAADERVRILGKIQEELRTSIKIIKAKDPSAAIPPQSENLLVKLGTLLERAKIDAEAEVKTKGAEWQKLLENLAAKKPQPPIADPAERAKHLLEAIDEIEEGLHIERAMLKRLKMDMENVLGPVASGVAPLRAEYDSLKPQRQSAKDPAPAPPVNRPALPGLQGDASAEFGELVNKMEGTAAKGENLSVDDLEKMVQVIQGKMDGSLKADLNGKYKKSWEEVKKEFKNRSKVDKAAAAEFMSKYWWFRRATVDKLMAKLQKQYNFKWGSVGSASLESDYDIAVRSHGTVDGKPDSEHFYDYQIVREFSKLLAAEGFSGVQSGTLFDTNLYAEAVVGLPDPARVMTETEKDMEAMAESGQDVGALMKMRRYMDWESYEDYTRGTLEDIKKAYLAEQDSRKKTAIGEQLKATQRQFEEADSLYFLSLQKQLKEAGIELPPDLSPEGQKKLLEEAHKLEGDSDKLMETNNKLYVEAMEEVRTIENTLKTETDPDERASLLSNLQTHQANATFFAAEAYHSKGPLKHIVEANQTSASKVKSENPNMPKAEQDKLIKELATEALKKLSATQMLQSFNENLGDLLKDLKHYEEKSPFPGLGFYRASKYLERVCDAMEWIQKKLAQEAPSAEQEFGVIKLDQKTPIQVKSAVAGLVDIRGGKKGFSDKTTDSKDGVDDPEAEKEAYAIQEMGKIFPSAKTLRDLGALMTGVGRQVNSVLRKAELGRKMMAKNEKAYFPG